jgi:outer membrane protein OmpA-like peptidoglycan-associated protein
MESTHESALDGPGGELLAERGEAVNYWPALLDIVTSSLMMFLVIAFLQSTLSIGNLDALLTHRRQDRFIAMLDKDLAPELASGAIRFERHLDYLQLTFSDRLLFEPGDYRLPARGRALLDRCARLLARAGTTEYRQIQVEGHTDNMPLSHDRYPTDNWELSTARALEVVELLAHSPGLSPGAFSASGYASFRPVATNETLAGRALNRRIELRLFFAGIERDTLAVEGRR